MLHKNKQLQPKNGLFKVIYTVFLLGFFSTAWSSGFQLFEQNAVVAGNYGAGLAVEDDDASIGFFNPAGLTNIRNPQVVLGADVIFSSQAFRGNTSIAPLGVPIPIGNQATARTTDVAPIPAFHFSMPISDRLVVGVSAVVPFGLATDWQDISPVRYSATKGQIQSVNVGPSFGFKVFDNFSIGAGFDAQYLKATLDSAIFTGGPDLISHNDASGWGYGWHVGGLYHPTPRTKIGLSFRSQVGQHLKGTSELRTPSGATLAANPRVKTNVTLPPTTILSIGQDLNDKWSVSGTAVYTQWSVFKTLLVQNVQTPLGLASIAIPQSFKNSWRFAVGTDYQVHPQWKLRMGVGYDRDPTNEYFRTVRLPDGDRIGLAIGAHYQPSKTFGIDMGYTHLFMFDGLLHSTLGPQNATVIGRVANNADILGLQVVWDIA